MDRVATLTYQPQDIPKADQARVLEDRFRKGYVAPSVASIIVFIIKVEGIVMPPLRSHPRGRAPSPSQSLRQHCVVINQGIKAAPLLIFEINIRSID